MEDVPAQTKKWSVLRSTKENQLQEKNYTSTWWTSPLVMMLKAVDYRLIVSIISSTLLCSPIFILFSCDTSVHDPGSLEQFPRVSLDTMDIETLELYEYQVREANDSSLLADVLIEKASLQREAGALNAALETWQEVFSLEKFIGNEKLAIVYTEIGNLLHYLDSSEESISYYKKAIALDRATNDHRGVAINLMNISAVYNHIQSYDSSIYYGRQVLGYCEQYSLDSLRRVYKGKFGVEFLENGEPDSAAKYLSAALLESTAGVEKAMALLNFGYYQERIGQLDTAFEYYVDAGKEAFAVNDYINLWKAVNNQAYSSYHLGEYRRAFILLDSLIFLKKDRDRIELAERISGLEKQYENLQREKELQELRFEMERTSIIRTTSIAIMVLALLVSGLVVNAVFSRMRQSRLMTNQRIAQLEREKELSALQTMIVAQEAERKRIAMDLHDGIGVLLSAARMRLSRLSKNGQNGEGSAVVLETEGIIENASREIRKVSHEMMPGVLTKLGLFEGIEELLESFEDKHGIKVKLTYPQLENRFSEKIEVMIYRIVQELINNSLKHSQASSIRIDFRLRGSHMHVEYADDGIGFNPKDASVKKSLGIQSIASRVKLLNGVHEIISAPGQGMQVTIDFDTTIDENTFS